MSTHAMRVSVSPDMIQKSTRLFNGTPEDILNELFQNSRRAGATVIEVEANVCGDSCAISITDNGCGIDHPGKVITLGTSAWEQDVIAREDPAGMGLFSLAGKHVEVETVTHAGEAFRILLAPTAWTGGELVPIDFSVTPEFAHGTRLRFAFAITNDKHGLASLKNLEGLVTKTARHLPVQVLFNGSACQQTDFLVGAVHVEEAIGLRIGVFENTYPNNSVSIASINFFGLTIQYNNLPTLTQVGAPHKLLCKIDIIDCPSLKLVLPARKELLMNAFIPEIEIACKRALFRYIAQQEHHSLSFDDYVHAKALGIELAEAHGTLPDWKPAVCDTDAGRYNNLDDYTDAQELHAPCLIIPDYDAPREQSLERALSLNKPFGFTLVEEQPQFAGYSWYDAIPVLTAIDVSAHYGDEIVDETNAYARAENHDTCRPDSITMELNIHHPATAAGDANIQTITLQSDLLMLDDIKYHSDPCDMPVLVRKTTDLTRHALESYMTDAYLSIADDYDADSRYTQQSNWENACGPAAVALLVGREEARLVEIKSAAERAIGYLVPTGTSLTISFAQGEANVNLTDAETKATQPLEENNRQEQVCNMLTLSTAHISQDTCNHILPQLCRTLPVWDKGGHGWFIYARLEQLGLEANIPDDLRNVLQYAAKRKCDYIMLDMDWPIAADLASFDW